jgi:hypothetical protein
MGSRFCCPLLPDRNKPLMARSEHWKSACVLPTFQVHPIGVRSPLSGEARLKTCAYQLRLEMPLWMKS